MHACMYLDDGTCACLAHRVAAQVERRHAGLKVEGIGDGRDGARVEAVVRERERYDRRIRRKEGAEDDGGGAA